MRLIDLTLPIHDGMDVYPGDPPVRVRQVRDLSESGWRLSEISFGSHTGTHVNAPWHMAEDGKRLDQIPLSGFVGRAVVRGGGLYRAGMGIIYASAPLDVEELGIVIRSRPAFVAQAAEFPMDEEVERGLCEAGIVSFENLANTSELPRGRTFLFAGLPLAVGGDGAPVRAMAMLGVMETMRD